MKHLLAAAAFVAVTAATAFAGPTLRYYNEDSTDYTWEATCSGSTYTVTFDHSRTSSVTIQGSAPCTLHAPSGDIQLTGDAKLHIKDGKVSVE